MKIASPHTSRDAERIYRTRMRPEGLVRFDVAVAETDLACFAEEDFTGPVRTSLEQLRSDILEWAKTHRGFFETLKPVGIDAGAPRIVRNMCEAARAWGVGPMAAVAGALADAVGGELSALSSQVIIENGGDIYIRSSQARRIAIFAGDESPFGEISLIVRPEDGVGGVCTSSGVVGHSMSFGAADAVTALAGSAALADAAATAICNRIRATSDVAAVIEAERNRGLLSGLVVIMGETLGAFGAVEFA